VVLFRFCVLVLKFILFFFLFVFFLSVIDFCVFFDIVLCFFPLVL